MNEPENVSGSVMVITSKLLNNPTALGSLAMIVSVAKALTVDGFV